MSGEKNVEERGQRHTEQFYGRATCRLKPYADSWLITRKPVLLLNDTFNSALDFYHL
jgi:anthranilate 1,2-dioxygenase (deaminating, decarboxylating) small subunit